MKVSPTLRQHCVAGARLLHAVVKRAGFRCLSLFSKTVVGMQLLRRSKSALVLMDVSTELPDLKRTKGLTNWLVRGQSRFYAKWEEAIDEAVRPFSTACSLAGMDRQAHACPEGFSLNDGCRPIKRSERLTDPLQCGSQPNAAQVWSLHLKATAIPLCSPPLHRKTRGVEV